MEYSPEAIQKLVSFLKSATPDHVEKMYLIMAEPKPMLAYKTADWFVAMDPYNGRFFIDEDLMFPYSYDFHTDRELHLKVDDWGKTLMDKARRKAFTKWMAVTF